LKGYFILNVRYNKYVNELKRVKARLEAEKREPTQDELERVEVLLDYIDTVDRGSANPDRDLRMLPGGSGGDSVTTSTRGNSPFESFGEQVRAIIQAGTPGQTTDSRLHEVRAATGLSQGVGGDGGFLLQSEFSYDLVKGIFDTGFLANRMTRFKVGPNKNQLTLPAIDETSRATGSRWGGIQLFHVAEAGLKTASQPKFRRLELNLNKLVGVCYVTDELMDDVTALDNYLRMGFREEFGYMLDYTALHGSGAGRGLGVMNSGSLVTASKEVGQAGSTILWENIQSMWARLLPKCRANAVWCIGQDSEKELWGMSQSVGAGGSPVYLPASGASVRPFSTLMGRPVIVMEQCNALGTSGDIVLMDPSWIVLADKGGMKEDYSIHLRFLYDEGIVRLVYRYDLQPILASPITPANASDTLSSHVALEDRS